MFVWHSFRNTCSCQSHYGVPCPCTIQYALQIEGYRGHPGFVKAVLVCIIISFYACRCIQTIIVWNLQPTFKYGKLQIGNFMLASSILLPGSDFQSFTSLQNLWTWTMLSINTLWDTETIKDLLNSNRTEVQTADERQHCSFEWVCPCSSSTRRS